ncbi:MAG: rod shape-determining protein MreD [Actinobacteria bacterium]|nr:rod shape-determining protein MreD [Actinomycetota bacterium]
MYTRRGSYTAAIFLVVYLIELMVIDQVHLPLGGFSLFLIFLLSWSALSSPENGAVAGFFGGLLLDLSPSSNGPVGQWALILAAVGFGIAFLRYGDDSLRGSPLSLVVFVAAAAVIAISLYVLFNSLFGLEVGSLPQLIRTIIGNGLWTLAIAPFVLPVASRLHRSIFETREF